MADEPTLVAAAEQELKTEAAACGAVQADVETNVCRRVEGHTGPHVAQDPDGTWLQFED